MNLDGPEPTNSDFTVLMEIIENDHQQLKDTYDLLVMLLQDLPVEKKIAFDTIHNEILKAKDSLDIACREIYEVNFLLYGNEKFKWEQDYGKDTN